MINQAIRDSIGSQLRDMLPLPDCEMPSRHLDLLQQLAVLEATSGGSGGTPQEELPSSIKGLTRHSGRASRVQRRLARPNESNSRGQIASELIAVVIADVRAALAERPGPRTRAEIVEIVRTSAATLAPNFQISVTSDPKHPTWKIDLVMPLK